MDTTFLMFVLAVAVFAAVGVVLLLVGYMVVIPASIVRSWLWAGVVVFVPVLGPLFFCRAYPEGLRKTRLQIMFGTLCLMAAIALLYGGGPWVAQELVNSAKVAS